VTDLDSAVNWNFWLTAAIESGQVTVDTQRLASSGPAVTSPKFPLQCCVWTYKYWTPGEKGIDQIQLRTLIEYVLCTYFAQDLCMIELNENNLQKP
jgi:hypothetical protein